MIEPVISFRVQDRDGTWLEWSRPGVEGWRLNSYARHLAEGVYRAMETLGFTGRVVQHFPPRATDQ